MNRMIMFSCKKYYGHKIYYNICYVTMSVVGKHVINSIKRDFILHYFSLTNE